MPELVEILADSNPWWANRGFKSGIKREKYVTKIIKYLEGGELVVLDGIRRSGKTTLLYQTVRELIETEKTPISSISTISPEKILFVDFENPIFNFLENPLRNVLETYKRDICSEKGTVLIFDEIQNIPGWEEEIRVLQEKKEHRIILSVSSARLLDCKLSVLTGGEGYRKVPVYPLDFSEYLLFREFPLEDSLKNPEALEESKYRIMNLLKTYLNEGGFSRVALEKDENIKKEHLLAYFDSIMYRDIVLQSEVRNARVLQELVHHFLANFTAPYSYRKLGKFLKLDFSTLKEYIYYTEQAKLLFEAQHFNPSGKTGGRKNKKIYCIDNGLRNSASFTGSESEGKLAENLVFLELRRKGHEASYWEGSRGEVKFVIRNKDGSLCAINVSYKDRPEKAEIKALLGFAKTFGPEVKELVLITKDIEKENEGIRYIPLWKWLLKSG